MTDQDVNSIIAPMRDAALKAAHIALLRRKDGVNFYHKPDGSRVSSGDYQSEQIIKSELEKISPALAASLGVDKIGFLMEENLDGNQHDFANRNHGYQWVVDPIDGTSGYTQRHNQTARPWAVSIALEKDGKTVAGMVYEASANEYGNTTQDFSSIDPEHPQGKIFWAHQNVLGARCEEGGFTVTANNAITQRQNPRFGGLMTLESIPEMQVDSSTATTKILDANTKIAANARSQIDGFYQDGQTRSTAQEAPYKRDFVTRMGVSEYDDCYSAVAGAMRAADGRSNAYLSGRGFPWDHSAARLILDKSGAKMAEYRVGDGSDERSMLIGGRDVPSVRKMMQTVEKMRDDQGQPIVTPLNPAPQTFVGQIFAALGAIGSWFGFTAADQDPDHFANQSIPQPQAAYVLPRDEVKTLAQLPRNVEALMQLSDEQKVLMSACVASGCDAVAYYQDQGQGLQLTQKINLYPKTAMPAFSDQLAGYQANTFADDEAVRANDAYHIPVFHMDASGNPTDRIKGVIVLHAPTQGFSEVAKTDSPADMHEPANCRRAKLKMASDIVQEHQDLFGSTGQFAERHQDIDRKLPFFRKLVDDVYATFPDGDQQKAHMDGVGNWMAAVESTALNNPGSAPLLDEKQSELLQVLAKLHDIGKSAMSSSFMRPWAKTGTQEMGRDFMGHNHNHPLFTLIELLMYPTDAKMAAAHHHGLFRYGTEELKAKLGEEFDKYHILEDNLRPEQISPLSRILRICDVAESITGNRKTTPIPLEKALEQLGERASKPDFNQDSIDANYLCFLIHSGTFNKMAETVTHNPEALKSIQEKILEQHGWNQDTASKEQQMRAAIAADPVLRDPHNMGRVAANR